MPFYNGYRVENFCNASQFEPEYLKQKRRAYIQKFLLEKAPDYELNWPDSVSNDLRLCFNELNSISLDEATKWDLLLYEQVIGRVFIQLSKSPRTLEEQKAYHENIEQTMKLAQYLSGHSRPWMNYLATLLMVIAAVSLAGVFMATWPVSLGVPMGIVCFSIGLYLVHQARATGLAEWVEKAAQNAKVGVDGDLEATAYNEEYEANLLGYFKSSVVPNLSYLLGVNHQNEYDILRYGLQRRVARGYDPVELQQCLMGAVASFEKDNTFDLFGEVARICGVYLCRNSNSNANLEQSTEYKPSFNYHKKESSSPEQPEFHTFTSSKKGEIEEFILMYHESPFEVLGISPEGCDSKTVREAFLKKIRECHPDKNRDATANEMSQKVNAAFCAVKGFFSTNSQEKKKELNKSDHDSQSKVLLITCG